MKAGDKVVCINTGDIRTFNGKFKKAVHKIKENEFYRVSDKGHSYDITLYEVPGAFYLLERFVTLEQYRVMKIKKLKNNMMDVEKNNA